MKRSKDISRIRKAIREAVRAENNLNTKISALTLAINETTGVDGSVDFLPGDGFAFAPEPLDTHVSVEDILTLLQNGTKITKGLLVSMTSL